MSSKEPYDSLYDEEYEEIRTLDGNIVSTETLRNTDFESIKNDLPLLICLAFVKYEPDSEVIKYLQGFDKLEVFHRTIEMVHFYPDLAYRAYNILGEAVGHVAAEWLKTQWAKSEDHDLRFFAKPFIQCLGVDAAFEIITKEIEQTDIGNIGSELEELLLFKDDRVLDWIESVSNRVTTIKTQWGHLTAGSNFSWQRAKKWLSYGRPLSLIALDALMFCTTHQRHKDKFNSFQTICDSLPDFPDYEIVAYRLQEFLLHDYTARSVNSVTSILESMKFPQYSGLF